MGKVITVYAGSLFVGRCPSNKLKEHFYDFLKENELNPRNLLNIGMDGLSVNIKFHHELIS